MGFFKAVRSALGWPGALFTVLSAVALLVWLIEGLESAHGLIAKTSLDGKLVIALLACACGHRAVGLASGEQSGRRPSASALSSATGRPCTWSRRDRTDTNGRRQDHPSAARID